MNKINETTRLADYSQSSFVHGKADTLTTSIDSSESSVLNNNNNNGDRVPMEMFYKRHNKRNYMAFWLLGMINNFHYCLVITASNTISEEFHFKKYVALITWANVVGGIFIRVINAFCCPGMPYKKRFVISGVQTILGVSLVAVSPWCGTSDLLRFVIVIFGALSIGNGSSWGESVALGYIERFPSNMVGGWSSGTGLSGVLATLYYLAMVAVGLNRTFIFFISLILVLIYWISFYFFIAVPVISKETVNGASLPYLHSSNWKMLSWTESELYSSQSITDNVIPLDSDACSDSYNLLNNPNVNNTGERRFKNPFLKGGKLWNMWHSPKVRLGVELHKKIFWNCFNLFLIYVFEYAVQLVAPFCFPDQTKSASFWLNNSFVITQLSYQAGVFISRSSLACLRISKISVLTILQLINAVCWMVQAKTLFLADRESSTGEMKYAIILYVWMIYVGLLGGASYVNVFYNILETNFRCSSDPINYLTLSSPTYSTESSHNADLCKREGSGTNSCDRDCLDGSDNCPQFCSPSELKERRQLCMNIGALYVVAGITTGCFLDVIFSNTILK